MKKEAYVDTPKKLTNMHSATAMITAISLMSFTTFQNNHLTITETFEDDDCGYIIIVV